MKLSALLLADNLHLSHSQLARVVRHDFAHPFLGFVLRYGVECVEGFRRFRLSHVYTPRV